MVDIQVYGSSSKGNCYILQDQESKLMIEAGIKLRTIYKKGGSLKGVKALLVTHEHGDHCKYAQDILASGGFDLWASKGTIEAINLKRRYQLLKSGHQQIIDGWTIYPFDVKHDVAEPLGFIIVTPYSKEKIVFITDTKLIKNRFKNVDIFMIECNYSMEILNENSESGLIPEFLRKRIINSHMNIETLAGFFEAIDLEKTKQIILMHLSNDNSDAELFKTTIEKVTNIPVTIAF